MIFIIMLLRLLAALSEQKEWLLFHVPWGLFPEWQLELQVILLNEAADVMLKERRPLVIVPRETPLHQIQLENMLTLSKAGATILPAMPGFYHNPTTMDELIDFVVGKALDVLGVEHELFKRWGSES